MFATIHMWLDSHRKLEAFILAYCIGFLVREYLKARERKRDKRGEFDA